MVTGELRAWWLDRFTLQEIVEMASAAWGPPTGWGEDWRDGFLFEAPVREQAA